MLPQRWGLDSREVRSEIASPLRGLAGSVVRPVEGRNSRGSKYGEEVASVLQDASNAAPRPPFHQQRSIFISYSKDRPPAIRSKASVETWTVGRPRDCLSSHFLGQSLLTADSQHAVAVQV